MGDEQRVMVNAASRGSFLDRTGTSILRRVLANHVLLSTTAANGA